MPSCSAQCGRHYTVQGVCSGPIASFPRVRGGLRENKALAKPAGSWKLAPGSM